MSYPQARPCYGSTRRNTQGLNSVTWWPDPKMMTRRGRYQHLRGGEQKVKKGTPEPGEGSCAIMCAANCSSLRVTLNSPLQTCSWPYFLQLQLT